MRFDSVGLGYSAHAGQIFVHYPARSPDGTHRYGGGFPIGPIPERYRTTPPNEITAERVALWDELLAEQSSSRSS